jgi:hypothetical protein
VFGRQRKKIYLGTYEFSNSSIHKGSPPFSIELENALKPSLMGKIEAGLPNSLLLSFKNFPASFL